MEGYSKDSMVQQAQHVWSMLDDMANNDPAAYKKFIDKQMAEKKEYASPPEPHMCIQTQMTKPQKVPFFINFCSWKRIPAPSSPQEPVRVGGSGIGQLKDDKGKCAVTAVAFNIEILKDYGKDAMNKQDQDTLIQIAMDFIEKQHTDVKLVRTYKVLERSHKGSLKVIQDSLFQAFKSKDKEMDDNIANMMQDFSPLATEDPATLLQQLNKENGKSDPLTESNDDKSDNLAGITLNTQPTRKGLIEEISTTKVTLPEPVYDLKIVENSKSGSSESSFVLKISLPGVKSVTECELDISKDDITLYVEEKYEFKLTLPSSIKDEVAAAKFNKKSSTLTLTMPIS